MNLHCFHGAISARVAMSSEVIQIELLKVER